MNTPPLPRRALLIGVATLIVPSVATSQQVFDGQTFRDAHCGCCLSWVEHMRASGRIRLTVTDAPDMAAIKQRLGVPPELASCHTTSVGGFVVEGHTPVADIVRLLEERPRGVRGLAVPGMPMGSPGMDRADGRREAYNVMAFGTEGEPRVFTRYAAI
ncbi:MAG: DUF411 domain-containing protein [Hyphomonadaceae bacterium]